MAFPTYWFWRPRQLNEHWAEVHTFYTNEYPHPHTVDTEQRPTSAESVWFSTVDSDDNLFINWGSQSEAITAPPMWFVAHEAPSPFPGGPLVPHTIIHAMHGEDFSSGTIVRGDKITELGIPITAVGAGRSERTGYVSFAKDTSIIQQVTVNEQWRRKRIALMLFSVADLVIVSNRRNTYLNGGHVTTNDGEKLREAWSGSKRVIPRSGSVG